MYLQFGLLKPLKNRGTCRRWTGLWRIWTHCRLNWPWWWQNSRRNPGAFVALVKINGSISGNKLHEAMVDLHKYTVSGTFSLHPIRLILLQET